MLGSMISGIILSRYVFKSIRIMGVAVLMENVHMICQIGVCDDGITHGVPLEHVYKY